MTLTDLSIGAERRALPLTVPVNLRDLAGVQIDGGTVRDGFAIRADDLSTVTDAFADRIVSDGLRAVIDLRSRDELEVTGRGPLANYRSVTFHHIPFMTSIGQGVQSAGNVDAWEQHAFGDLYLNMYEAAAPQIVMALAVIAHAPGTVAFHCAAGQDRTGVLAASLLLTLGAERDDVVADYARTGENSEEIRRRIAPLIDPLMQRLGVDLDAAARGAGRTGFSSAPMEALLDTMRERYDGDSLVPLRRSGLTDALIAQLRRRALAAA